MQLSLASQVQELDLQAVAQHFVMIQLNNFHLREVIHMKKYLIIFSTIAMIYLYSKVLLSSGNIYQLLLASIGFFFFLFGVYRQYRKN